VHEQGVSAVRLTVKGDINLERFERWVDALLNERHEDIYRMKGILSIPGEPKRYIFQAVHALSSWQYGRPWNEGERETRMVLIGRNIDRERVEEGFFGIMNYE
jgi:G3E family GTPase